MPRKLSAISKTYKHRTLLVVLVSSFVYLLFSTQSVFASRSVLNDDFSNVNSKWNPVLGSWIVNNGKYQQKTVGDSYTKDTSNLFTDDFSSAVVSTIGTVFTDSFTQGDGAASQWTVKRPTFNVVSSEYNTQGPGSLSIPTDNSYLNWTNYRFKAKVKRLGASDAYGYSMLYFRLNMADATKDNSYALLLRQTGVMEVYKRTNGTFGPSALKSVSGIVKDNNYHDITILVIGSRIKVWIDKAESVKPDLDFIDTSYSTGTIGLGTNGWDSNFDDVQIETATTDRWDEKNGYFYVNSGKYNSIYVSGVNNLSILKNTDSLNWSSYKISTKFQRSTTNANDSADVFFRTTMVDTTNQRGYALRFKQNNYAYLYQLDNGWTSPIELTKFAVTADTNWHDLIIDVSGNTVKIWIDRTEDKFPNLEYSNLSAYTSGTVGVGSSNTTSSFDDFIVESIISSKSYPSHLYDKSNNTTTITTSSNSNLDNLTISITNPLNTTWNLDNMPACDGVKSCSVTFPTDFSNSNIDTIGTYLVSVDDGINSAFSFIEVRETPNLAFFVISDAHIQSSGTNLDQAEYLVTDINNNKDFPTSNFLAITGDITEVGTLAELPAAKSKFDLLSIPYYPIVGGHDNLSDTPGYIGQLYESVFGTNKFTYSWISGNYLFMAIDEETSSYSGYGANMNSSQHHAWMESTLNSNSDKYAILFTHWGLNSNRDAGDALYYRKNYPYARTALESSSKFLINFAGHSHTNQLASLNNIYYSHSPGFSNQDEYRYIELYDDRVEAHILNKRIRRYDCSACYWAGSTDSTHTAATYSWGLPIERQFKINIASKTSDILDNITVSGNTDWEDYSYQTDITLKNDGVYGENIGGVVFRYKNNNNYYSILLDSARDTISLEKVSDGTISTLNSVSTTISLDTVYTVKVLVKGSSIKVFLSDDLKIDTTDTSFKFGKIGLRSFRALSDFDNVLVSNLDDDKNPPTKDTTSCEETTPKSAPFIKIATPQSSSSILLSFDKAEGAVEYYELKFGDSPDSFQWGSTYIGDKNTRSYLVKSLSPYSTYYFKIRAGNGCAAGSWSDVISSKTISFKNNSQTVLGANSTRNSLNSQSISNEANSTKKEEKTTYVLKVIVNDNSNGLVKGAKVSIYPNNKELYTKDDGFVEFNNLEKGNYKISVSYNNNETSKTIDLYDNKELKVVIDTKSNWSFNLIYIISIILLLVIIILLFRIKQRSKASL